MFGSIGKIQLFLRKARFLSKRSAAIGFLFFVFSLFANEIAIAQDQKLEEWTVETFLVRENIESGNTDAFAVVQEIEESNVHSKMKTSNKLVKPKYRKIDYSIYDANVETSELNRSASVFSGILKYSRVASDSVYGIAENDVDQEINSEPNLGTGEALDPSKTYTVTASGNVVAVDPNAYRIPEKTKRIVGNGWVVLAEDEVKKDSELENQNLISGNKLLQASAGGSTEIGSDPMLVFDEFTDNTPNKTKSIAKEPAGLFVIDPYLKEKALAALEHNDKNESENIKGVKASGNYTTSVRGRVIVPEGYVVQDVRVRIAGTGFEVGVSSDGLFELPELPLGSKAELLIWDTEAKLTRRLVPITALNGQKSVEITLEPMVFIDSLARSFGIVQDIRKAGFCGSLDSFDGSSVLGAKITVFAAGRLYPANFFDSYGLPNSSLQEPGDAQNRFCVFNVDHELLDIAIDQLNGQKTVFTIHLKPTIFETNLKFSLFQAVYKSIAAYELIDFDESMKTKNTNQAVLFASIGMRSWYDGRVSADWAKATGMYVSGDNAYAPALHYDTSAAELIRFSVGDEFSEVKWAINESRYSGFTLKSKSQLLDSSAHGKTEAAPLRINMMDDASVSEMEQLTGEGINIESGGLFVNVDTSFLGVDYRDIRVLLTDTWTSEQVGTIHYVRPLAGSANPKYVRFFVSDLKPGQHLLQILDKNGAVKWLDVVRSRPQLLQVISVEDTL